MARLMALDVGEVRIGVAISDATGFLASPYTTLHVSRDEAKTWEAIRRLIGETEVEGLVIGLPISLDGQIHAQAERVQAFARRLQQQVSIPLTFWDERLSTVEAQRLLSEREQEEQGMYGRRGGGGRNRGRSSVPGRGRRKHQEIDALAAAVILQEYLDHQSSRTGDRQL